MFEDQGSRPTNQQNPNRASNIPGRDKSQVAAQLDPTAGPAEVAGQDSRHASQAEFDRKISELKEHQKSGAQVAVLIGVQTSDPFGKPTQLAVGRVKHVDDRLKDIYVAIEMEIDPAGFDNAKNAAENKPGADVNPFRYTGRYDGPARIIVVPEAEGSGMQTLLAVVPFTAGESAHPKEQKKMPFRPGDKVADAGSDQSSAIEARTSTVAERYASLKMN